MLSHGSQEAKPSNGDPMDPPTAGKPHGSPRCGARTRSGSPCRNVAGKGTNHLGIGRCKFHGGATPIRHGRYSTVVRESVGELIARENRKKGIKWNELGGLIEEFWRAVEIHVEDPDLLNGIADDWERIYDAWELRGLRDPTWLRE